MKTLCLLLMLVGLLSCGGGADVPNGDSVGKAPAPPVPVASGGTVLYAAHCATCHGADGRGRGPAAEFVFPRPRDFSIGVYKIRSTADGELPTDEDLDRTIRSGIPGTSMPSFEFLGSEQRKTLIDVLKSFAVTEVAGEKKSLFVTRGSPRVIRVGEAPPYSEQQVAQGRTVYRKMACGACHGPEGKGDGPSAPTLTDRWGMPDPPANLTRGILKGGGELGDIYLRFTTGLSGTPMPSFEGNLSEADRWALSCYVKSLSPKDQPPIRYASEQVLRMGTAKELPLDPWHPAWEAAPPLSIPLMMIAQRTEAPDVLAVRALRSAEHVAFVLEWTDSTVDGSLLRPTEFSDAAAVMFAQTEPAGHFSMGEKGKPVTFWYWRFARQLDRAFFRDLETIYPDMIVDSYPQGGPGKPGVPPGVGGTRIVSTPSHQAPFQSGWAAGNTVSDPAPASSVENLSAEGFGTLKSRGPEHQTVQGQGVWKDGRWRVMLRRPLRGTSGDPSFEEGKPIHAAFAVWDGHAGDRDGKKLVTFWQRIEP